jgi:ankyrin repeat protein
VVDILLQHGADVIASDSAGLTAVTWAAQKRHRDVIHLLLAAGAVNNNPSTSSADLISEQEREISEEEMKASSESADLEFEIQYDHADNDRLIEAVVAGAGSNVTAMLDGGLPVNTRDRSGRTPLMWAMYKNRVNVVRILIAKGADCDLQDSGGRTALMWGALYGHWESINALFEEEIDVDRPDNHGRTALMWACINGNPDTVQAVLSVGPDIEARDVDGKTALTWACEKSNAGVVETLLMWGADPTARDNQDRSPEEIALRQGALEIAALLQSS